MPVKTPKATKDLAYQKLRDGLSNQEVADLTGLSLRSIGRMKSLLNGQSAMPARNARISQGQTTIGQDKPQTGNNEDKTTLDFADSPDPVGQKSIVDSALGSLKGMLGISDEPKPPPVFSAKLNEKQQRFVDATTPTIALGFMSLAVWLWGRIGPEYSVLAPNEDVARRIVEPLLRVYARHSSFVQEINPDVADIGASMFALVGYVNVSLNLYQQIKREKEEDEQGYRNVNRYRAAPATENGASDQSGGYDAVRGTNGQHAQRNGNNGGYPGGIRRDDLTDKEAKQYAALSRLSQLDYQHRARKSGRVA